MDTAVRITPHADIEPSDVGCDRRVDNAVLNAGPAVQHVGIALDECDSQPHRPFPLFGMSMLSCSIVFAAFKWSDPAAVSYTGRPSSKVRSCDASSR
jgi:hypothetical protein